VGYYHSHTPALQADYERKVLIAAAKVFGVGMATGQAPARRVAR
jgi:hypothetical protein